MAADTVLDRPDGIDRPLIGQVVRTFYDLVRRDTVLGPIFNPRVEVWPAHEAKIVRFWSSVLLMSGEYHGKPYLTFGIPRDAFIPMAGVAEFTLGFGLLSTVLIRRLSAIALFIIFNAAVYPFGRIDLIGHGLIMAALVAVASHSWREGTTQRGFGATFVRIPASLAAAIAAFSFLYWGAHDLIYRTVPANLAENHSTHSPDPDHPHPIAEAQPAVPIGTSRLTRTALVLP